MSVSILEKPNSAEQAAEFGPETPVCEIRRKILARFEAAFSDKIRAFSMMLKESERVCKELGLESNSFFLGIGEMNAQNFSPELREKGGFIPGSPTAQLIEREKARIVQSLRARGASEFQYDLTGAGYRELREAIRAEQARRTGIDFQLESPSDPNGNRIFFTQGASSGFRAAFEALNRKLGRKPRVLFPVPMFMPVMLASDVFIEPSTFVTKPENAFQMTSQEAEAYLDKNDPIDALYFCPLNNPTSALADFSQALEVIGKCIARNPEVRIIVDDVYVAGSNNIESVREFFRTISERGWLPNFFVVDGDGKAKARTGKRAGALMVGSAQDAAIVSNVLRNSTGGPSSDTMIDSLAVSNVLDAGISQDIYREIGERRGKFLDELFANPKAAEFLAPMDQQPGLPGGKTRWQGGLYAFLRMREGVDVREFILRSGIVGTPGDAFGSPAYKDFIRLSFGYESFEGRTITID